MITFKVNDEAAFPISGKIAVALALLDYDGTQVLFPEKDEIFNRLGRDDRITGAESYLRDARDLARLLRGDLDSIDALGFSAQVAIEHGRLDDAARALKDQSRAIRSALYIVGRKSDLAYGVDDDA